MIPFAKAHAYGNDFLYVSSDRVEGLRLDGLAREMCDRRTGVGADGLIFYERTPQGARMRLFNADGGIAEVSGNGLRGLAALIGLHDERRNLELAIVTDAGIKSLVRIDAAGTRQTFRAAMGVPSGLRRLSLRVENEDLDLIVLSMGNPQAVLLGPLPGEERFRRLGAALERHEAFAEGTNVEFAFVAASDEVRIRIWERGVGPTLSSGTGACAALVAAATSGTAARAATVVAPGGSQLVEWTDAGVYLTGWAEIICEGEWLRSLQP
jgi:diaminopimelate epimerase